MLEDRDLISVQQARRLVEQADLAGQTMKGFSQGTIDQIVGSMARVAKENARRLAVLAVEETGRGKVEDKTQKNLFSAVNVYNHIKNLKTCGVIGEDKKNRVIEIGVPFGVIAVIVPTTNPTSTTIFKVLSAIKARNTVVISPHPQAVRCCVETARLMHEAALKSGAPENCINCMDVVTPEGTNELMRHAKTRLILATGGMGLVRAAYSSGKPAYGVGPGNVPAFIERTADVPKAVRDVLTGKTFDNGLLCSSEQSIVCDGPIRSQVLEELQRNHAHLLNQEDQCRIERCIVRADGRLNADIVGKSSQVIAKMAGVSVGEDVICLVGFPKGVGRDHPLSMEKLSPILAFYEVDGWREGCRKCMELLAFGGLGHTMAIHSRDQRVILQFGLEKPAHRICVNTPATHGSVGLTTGLPPSMTLGCGGPGGNITSDNITALHLINIRRLAFETRPSDQISSRGENEDPDNTGFSETRAGSDGESAEAEDPRAVEGPWVSDSVRRVVKSVVEEYLGAGKADSAVDSDVPSRSPETVIGTASGQASDQTVVSFVCEEDVKQALREKRMILVDSQTLITPLARDLGEEHQIFVQK